MTEKLAKCHKRQDELKNGTSHHLKVLTPKRDDLPNAGGMHRFELFFAYPSRSAKLS